MNIDELLNKYFEGETSCEEEHQLRTFFASENIPRRLLPYRAIFGYFSQEIARQKPVKSRLPFSRNLLLYAMSGVAACVLLLVAWSLFGPTKHPCMCEGSYVIVDGKCYTDAHMAQFYARAALDEVSTSTEEVFDLMKENGNREEDIVAEELNQLREILNE